MSIVAGSRASSAERLKITEIFLSIQGEAAQVGWPTVFVRLTGCPLRCGYCDTAYAFHGGTTMSFEEILAAVGKHGIRHVCVTGGEPLARKNCPALLTSLCEAGYDVSLETSGTFDISMIDPRVRRVMDLKTPGSGEMKRNRMENLAQLSENDVLKFVICDRTDYEWARDLLTREQPVLLCEVFFSPVWEQLALADLAAWILEDTLSVRLQTQLHKHIWGEEPGH
jgi:7-carboxy-7-deazaguanine synthase